MDDRTRTLEFHPTRLHRATAAAVVVQRATWAEVRRSPSVRRRIMACSYRVSQWLYQTVRASESQCMLSTILRTIRRLRLMYRYISGNPLQRDLRP